MRVALRIEVSSVRGLREGIPNLLRLFSEFQVRASFFFPFGADYSGRQPLQTWRQRQALGTSALAYGTLMPAPPLAELSAHWMKNARDNGHDVGLFGLSPQLWRTRLGYADDEWVRQQTDELWSTYAAALGEAPVALATPGWQVHPALMGALQGARYQYSAMTRGKFPYLPLLQGRRSSVPEIPTTLPTIGELLQQADVDEHNVHEYLYAESRHVLPAGHVFAASAEYEGILALPLMEKLLVMWKGQDGSVRALADVLKDIDTATLPHHQIGWGDVEGAGSPVAMQSVQVPA